MSSTVKGILQKINFIEKDMELHKQILFSISPEDKEQVEDVVKKIAGFKSQIEELRLKIKEIDEDEYNTIIKIENATRTFQQMAQDKKFTEVQTLNESGRCRVTLTDGTELDCLVAAKEENGNWSVLTIDGDVKEFEASRIC